jgi:hypothetical protein
MVLYTSLTESMKAVEGLWVLVALQTDLTYQELIVDLLG